jgi:hypothetical protein
MNDWMLILFCEYPEEEEEEERTYSLRNAELLELYKFDKGNIDNDHHSSPEFE